jgi:S1-C subfamily serine protease
VLLDRFYYAILNLTSYLFREKPVMSTERRVHIFTATIFAVTLLCVAALATYLGWAVYSGNMALFGPPGSSTSSIQNDPFGTSNQGAPTPFSAADVAAADVEEALLVNIYERVSPAVVNVNVSANEEGELLDYGSGSGFVIDKEGHIVTNYHVVATADEVRVTFNDGRVFVAEVIGTDNYADIAVLKIDVPADYPLTVVEMGDSNDIKVGQRVIAIGNPFGLTGTMTVGIVSAMGRSLPTEVITQGGGQFSNPLIIQTDAAINPGNSGGPLLDSYGRVIGVTAAIRTTTGSNTGVGFAIPVNTVKRVAPQIIETGTVEYPYLGISAQSGLSMSELADQFNLPVHEGVLIQEVVPNGPSDGVLRGGTSQEVLHGAPVVLGGDIITAINGEPIRNFDELIGYLVSNTSARQTVILTIVRDGQTIDVEVTLGARPAQ